MPATTSIDGDEAVGQALLPLIPLRPLLTDNPNKSETAKLLLKAFARDGFLYLTDYEDLIPADLVKEVFAQSADFFKRPQSEKDALEWTGPRSNRGYTKLGQEKNSRSLDKDGVADSRLAEGDDLKESFEIGRDDEDGCPNQWPRDDSEETAQFKRIMRNMQTCCNSVHRALLSGIAIALGLSDAFFNDYSRLGDNTLRLLHYPPVPAGGFEDGRRVRAGAHSDYGSITLLFQDDAGGLQVERPGESGWFDVAPRKGTIVVNAGDLLSRWSNDLIRSTMHRVVEPPGKKSVNGHSARYSVAYFCNPDFDRSIKALPGTCEPGAEKYDSINSGEYLYQRLAATY